MGKGGLAQKSALFDAIFSTRRFPDSPNFGEGQLLLSPLPYNMMPLALCTTQNPGKN